MLKAPLFKQLGPGLVTGSERHRDLFDGTQFGCNMPLDDGVDLAPDEGGAAS